MIDNIYNKKLMEIMDKHIDLIIDCYHKKILKSGILDVVVGSKNLDKCFDSSGIDTGVVFNLNIDNILLSTDQQLFASICARHLMAREESSLINYISENAQTKQCSTDDIIKIINYVLTEYSCTKDQPCLIFYPRNLYVQLGKKYESDDRVKLRFLDKSSTQVIFMGHKSVKWEWNSECILQEQNTSLSSNYKSTTDKYHQHRYCMEHGDKIDFRIRSQNEYGIIHPENVCVYNLPEPNNKIVETVCE